MQQALALAQGQWSPAKMMKLLNCMISKWSSEWQNFAKKVFNIFIVFECLDKQIRHVWLIKHLHQANG